MSERTDSHIEHQIDREGNAKRVFVGGSQLAAMPGIPRGGCDALDLMAKATDDLAVKLAGAVPIGDVFDAGEFQISGAQAFALESLGYIRRDGNCWKRIA